jgi:hypothetical protein
MTDEQLSALLRLKRYEQPPAGYFDELLRDVHRRQREELIQRPLWRIALERLQCFFGETSFAPVSYAGALAVVLVTGIVSIHSMAPQTHEGPTGQRALASFSRATTPVQNPQDRAISLQPRQQALISQQQLDARLGMMSQTPRYVIDARPVSYDASFSF